MSSYLESMIRSVKQTPRPDKFHMSGPLKISLKKKRAFSLPAGPKFSCPGATEACSGCYAQKDRHLWGPVQTAFAKNWRLIKYFERYGKSEEAAQQLLNQIPRDAGLFRIYESGDFHSQWAVDLWSNVVRYRPDILFWAYTRSFDLNFTSLTRNKNFALWASTDDFNTNEAKLFVRRFRKSGTKHAYGPWPHDKELPENSFVCPATSGKIDVPGACEKCKLCVIKRKTSKNIVFLAH